jgi:hypothetical protein
MSEVKNMKTLTINIQDDFMQDFLSIVEHYHGKIEIQKDKNLEYDPYFYERQKELHQIRADVKSGKMEMLSEEQYEKEIEQFFSELEK